MALAYRTGTPLRRSIEGLAACQEDILVLSRVWLLRQPLALFKATSDPLKAQGNLHSAALWPESCTASGPLEPHPRVQAEPGGSAILTERAPGLSLAPGPCSAAAGTGQWVGAIGGVMSWAPAARRTTPGLLQ